MKVLTELLGGSREIAAIREQAERLLRRQGASRHLPPLLIEGETGTGKGLLARLIHQASPRSSGPFVEVNCAAIPETLLEAELFGYERGAFTDARQAKPGLFQVAHRGTIFLDEIGLLPEGLQAKLLKVVEERTVRRLGSTRTEAVDVWIITATNEDLAAAARARRYREDLYHRLAVLTLRLPPLRERGDDVLLLARRFLARACADYQLAEKRFDPDAERALLAQPWPGNVRELSNVIERVALLSEGVVITADMLDLPAATPSEPVLAAAAEPPAARPTSISAERAQILEVLRETGWNITRTATRLGLSRNALRYRMEKHGLRADAPPPETPATAAPPSAPAAAARAIPDRVAAPPGVRWERRRLTLLRTVLGERDGGDIRLSAGRALEAVVGRVQVFGGKIDELSATGVVAVFGLEPAEDAPQHAIHAAMAMQKAVERVREAAAGPLAIRIGIHVVPSLVAHTSGGAEIDLDTKRDAWTMLDALVSMALPDQILLSEAATPFLERRFRLVPVGAPGNVPGQAYHLAGRERPGLRLGRRMARFVGRHHELELLRSRLESAMRGHGQVVGLVGEAGIGKSRLLYEFRQSVKREDVAYVEARCVSYGASIPFHPVRELVRRACRVVETDTPEEIAWKIRGALEAVGLAAEDGVPLVLQLLGIKEGAESLAQVGPEAVNARTFDVLWQVVLGGSRRRPLILAVEDLHWVDRASEGYAAALVERLAGAPVLFVITYRPGYHPPAMEKSYATQIALQPLGPEDSLTVVRSVLRGEHVPGQLVQFIVEKAEGNPFFLEELARAVRDQGEALSALRVPGTVEEVLLARIDRLDPEAKRLLECASVLGREMTLRLLAAVWDGPGGPDRELRELIRLEFVYEQPGEVEPVVAFRHTLAQEVVHGSLPAGRRRGLHAAAGRALERLHAGRLDEVYEQLAYHYSEAEQADKAVEYLTYSAEKAAESFAHVEAVAALRAALAHVERLPVTREQDARALDLVIRQTHSLNFLGFFRQTLELLLGQRERVARLDDPTLGGAHAFWLSRTYSVLGDHEQAAASARCALAEAERAGDVATLGKAHFALAAEAFWTGRPREGVEHARAAVRLLGQADERRWLGQAHWMEGICLALLGQGDAALEAEERARALGDALGDPRLQCAALSASGGFLALRGDARAGIEACRQSVACSTNPGDTAVALGVLGGAYLAAGDHGQALPVLERAVRLCGEFGLRDTEGWFTSLLGEAVLLAGDPGRARTLVTRGLEINRDTGYRYGVGWAQRALGRIALAGGARDEASSRLREAASTFAEIEAAYDLGQTSLELARVADPA
jgi:DNA-binding NtrC family response regulator/tetratricopeptide (TPR) repeat protein